MSRYKEYHQTQIMLMPPSLEEKIPEEHLARYINETVDEMDIEDIEASYSDIGCKAYHPRMLLKILIYGYSIGVRSSRRIQKGTREDLVFMWLAGLQEPDFRTISDFRKGRIKDIQKLFKQILETCLELGMINCGKISIDGTKIEANSARNKMLYRKNLQKRQTSYEQEIARILKEAEEVDTEEDRLYGDQDGYTLERKYTKEEIRKALNKINRKKEKLEKKEDTIQEKLDIVKKKLDRMGDRNSCGITDKDATLMPMKEGYLGVGYNVQMATENQIIVGFGVFQRPNDNHLLQPMVEEVEQNLGMKPGAIAADKGYCSQSNYEYLNNKGIRAAIPPQTYDLDISTRRKGTYRCSQNLEYEKLKIGMLDFLDTAEGQELMDYRKHDIEPTFGDIKYNMGFRKLLLRSKIKALVEIGLMAIAHNLKKIKNGMERQYLAKQLTVLA